MLFAWRNRGIILCENDKNKNGKRLGESKKGKDANIQKFLLENCTGAYGAQSRSCTMFRNKLYPQSWGRKCFETRGNGDKPYEKLI